MVSIRPSTNTPSNEPTSFSELVHGEVGQQNEKVLKSFRKKLLGLKPKLPASFSFRGFDMQLEKNEKNPSSKTNVFKQKKSSAVQFALSPTIHTYEANPAKQCDVWWDHEELDLLRKETIAEDNASIKAYLIAYKRSFREIQSNDKVSSQNMADLVAGLDRGHRGLEIFTSLQQVERKNANLSVTASVVALQQQQPSKTATDTSRLIRAHSISLTSRSRHWAQAMGKADMYAANNVQKIDHAFLRDDR